MSHYNAEHKFLKCDNVSFTHVEDIEVPQLVRNKFQKMLKNVIRVFSNTNELLPYNTIPFEMRKIRFFSRKWKVRI